MAITLSLRRAAEESGLSMRTLQYAISKGELQSVCIGRRRLIPTRALETFLLRARESKTSALSRNSHP
jgi:excisionase family DNA binding protein